MLGELIEKKARAHELTLADYYSIVDMLMKRGLDKSVMKMFLGLNSFGMTKREVLYLSQAMRDSGRVLKYNHCIFEKHSTGGIGDATSVVLIPLIASLGYKIIKTTAKSFVFTNGTADRFGAIPGFKVQLTEKEIEKALDTTNACILSHSGDMCPADKLLYELREQCGIENDINLLAASIASKKMASGAKVVLVDVKYGDASIVKTRAKAEKLADILKYVFKKSGVKSIIVITNTWQTIGEGIGNAIEVADAINVLQGKKCLLRDVSIQYATEMILAAEPKLKKEDVIDMVAMALDNGTAYSRFLEIVKAQGGDKQLVADAKLFQPYQSTNFVADREGYVGNINSLMLGELTRRLCEDSHDGNIGAVLRVKIGDYVRPGDIIVSFYYKDKEDFEKYREAIAGCVRITNTEIKPVKVITKVIR
ncbi:MAG: thymidine phosphorylase [Clostridiales bacterium]|nr:thymidine phosphorylase [Clostridiales bacterium]